jgi:hypothetical protein
MNWCLAKREATSNKQGLGMRPASITVAKGKGKGGGALRFALGTLQRTYTYYKQQGKQATSNNRQHANSTDNTGKRQTANGKRQTLQTSNTPLALARTATGDPIYICIPAARCKMPAA